MVTCSLWGVAGVYLLSCWLVRSSVRSRTVSTCPVPTTSRDCVATSSECYQVPTKLNRRHPFNAIQDGLWGLVWLKQRHAMFAVPVQHEKKSSFLSQCFFRPRVPNLAPQPVCHLNSLLPLRRSQPMPAAGLETVPDAGRTGLCWGEGQGAQSGSLRAVGSQHPCFQGQPAAAHSLH